MFHYYMFYKPYGCVTAKRDERYPVVMDYFEVVNSENKDNYIHINDIVL